MRAIPPISPKASSLPSERTIFVAHPYTTFDKKDYRRPFKDLEKAFEVKFIFADERISSETILDKIVGYIKSTAFGLYDISTWNPNVTLELGVAFGLKKERYILFNPKASPTQSNAPTDVQGFERIQWASFSELEERLSELLAQRFPVERNRYEEQIQSMHQDIAAALAEAPAGLKATELAARLKVSKDYLMVALRPMIGKNISQLGAKRGTYYKLRKAKG